jgi:hypothetical protein
MPAGIGVKLSHMRSAERELHRLILIIAIKRLLDVLVKGPVIPSTARDLFVKRREFGRLRFLVATLLGMTGGGLGMKEALLRPFYGPIFLECQRPFL